MPRIIILGGGISGLATAHFLLEENDDFDLLLLEAEDRLGGTLGSETVDGFVFERGANGFLDNVSDGVDLARQIGLGERLRVAAPSAKNRYILKNSRLLAVPTTPAAFLRSPLLSLRGRLRVLLEPFQSRAPEGVEDSVASFGRRRLGAEAVRTLLDPMVTGIHAADVERLSLRSAFPRIAGLESEYGSLIRALVARRRERKRPGEAAAGKAAGPAGPGGQLHSFAGGLEELVQALATPLGERVRLGWRATAIEKQGEGFLVRGPGEETESADGVVLALPTYRAASLFASSDPETARALEAIPYAPIAVVCLGFPRDAVAHPLDGFGFLVPRTQGLRLLGCIWVSSIYPEHAPEGMVSLRSMFGGARDPDALDLSGEQLEELALRELRPVLGIEGAPVLTRVYRYARGIPQYNLGHGNRIDRIERRLWDLPGLFITGNAYYGIGINDCVREGQRKARAVREFFRKL